MSYIYVDDSKVAKNVTSEDEIYEFQNELNEFYSWASINKMKFNEGKFVALRYGKNEKIKDETLYFTDNMSQPIDILESHKDLGIIMSSDAGFSSHIEAIIKKIRKKMGWIYRSFYCRKLQFMRQIFISLIRPHMDYFAQLWDPQDDPQLDKLKK